MAEQDDITYGPYGALRRRQLREGSDRSALAPRTTGTGANTFVNQPSQRGFDLQGWLTAFAPMLAQQQGGYMALRAGEPGPPAVISDQPGGSNEGAARSAAERGGTYGPASKAEMGTISAIAGGPVGMGMHATGMDQPTSVMGRLGRSLANTGVKTGLSFAGVPTMGFGFLSGLASLAALAERNRGRLGLSPSRGYIGLSALDLQDIQDTYGKFAADAARAMENARTNPLGAALGESEPGGYSRDPEGGAYDPSKIGAAIDTVMNDPYGPGPQGAPSMGDSVMGGAPPGADVDTGWGGSNTDSSSQGGQGQEGSSNTGGAPGGDAPGNWAKGGVARFTRPTRPLVGEAGPEKGIFIPKTMERKGIQPRELQVIRGMLRALKRLGS